MIGNGGKVHREDARPEERREGRSKGTPLGKSEAGKKDRTGPPSEVRPGILPGGAGQREDGAEHQQADGSETDPEAKAKTKTGRVVFLNQGFPLSLFIKIQKRKTC